MKTPLLNQYDLHHRLYMNVLADFTDEETNRRLEGYPQVNHVKYLAGHLLNSQYGLATLAGLNPEVKWNEHFAVGGQSEARDDYSYPHIDEIKNEWNAIHSETRGGLEALTEAELAEKPPAPFDQLAESVVDLWAFLNHHQAYHIGQIALLRRGFGKAPMRFT